MGICHNLYTMEELAEFLEVDPTTIARCWKIFRAKAGAMLEALSKKLTQSSQLTHWAGGKYSGW